MTTRTITRAVAILACGLSLMATPTASIAQRNEIDILSYETGLSKGFLEQYEEAAQKLNIAPAKSELSRILGDEVDQAAW